MLEGRNGSIITLSYLGLFRPCQPQCHGACKSVLEAGGVSSNTDGTGIIAEWISAGPIRPLQPVGLKTSVDAELQRSRTPLRRNTTIEEVGNTAAFLASDLASESQANNLCR